MAGAEAALLLSSHHLGPTGTKTRGVRHPQSVTWDGDKQSESVLWLGLLICDPALDLLYDTPQDLDQ